MWTAILWKELRECGLYAGLALLAMIHYLGSAMNLPLVAWLRPGRSSGIPFVDGSEMETIFTTIAVLAAIVLGLHQSIWESWRQTTLFLLHRPLPRNQLFVAKLLSGCLMLVGIAVIPLLVYSLWASMPGTHASPFYWSMTEGWWRSVAVAWICYLGAFLTGLRPAHWLGSRTWPLIAALTVALFLKFLAYSSHSLIVNGFITFIGLWLVSKRTTSATPPIDEQMLETRNETKNV